jgi:hypothetical protein
MSNLYRGPSIDVSYQVSVHLAEGFQMRRLKCEKLTDDGRLTPSDGKSSHCLWQGELRKLKIEVLCKNEVHFVDTSSSCCQHPHRVSFTTVMALCLVLQSATI